MTKKTALLFAGQGAQVVGMGKDLAAAYPSVAALVRQADEILGRDLSRIMFEGPDTELTQTANCQPALYVHGIACLTALREELGDFAIAAAAGLSLGEFTAHAAAGTYDFETGLRLVDARSRYMQEACEATTGAMAAMIGAEESVVRALAAETDVDVSNLNTPGQVVISGETAKVMLAISLSKDRGIRRAAPLNVAGAYHSRLMQSAYVKLGAELEKQSFHEPKFPVVCNIDAQPVREPARIRETLREQVTGTVRWAQSIEYLIDREQIEQFIELGPGAVLAGMVGRIRKGADVLSVADAASVKAVAAVLKDRA
ncbi:MAG TPA: ACP S-malonyltransferase [Chthoniobacteraceae bacterium]|nr:ACP S-malonyltransferase [Chthoniobacteraceae bacterium]